MSQRRATFSHGRSSGSSSVFSHGRSSGPRQSSLGGGQRPKPEPKPEPKPAMPAPTYDSSYTRQTAANDLGYQTDVNQINLQRDRIGFDTGYGAGGQVDPRNPYSQAMHLQRSWEQDQRGISTSMAARGQLYSGARQRGLNESTYNYQRNSSGLQTQAQRGYEDLTSAEQRAKADQSARQADIYGSQADRWTQAQRDWFERYG